MKYLAILLISSVSMAGPGDYNYNPQANQPPPMGYHQGTVIPQYNTGNIVPQYGGPTQVTLPDNRPYGAPVALDPPANNPMYPSN